jgi:hypothetical protein
MSLISSIICFPESCKSCTKESIIFPFSFLNIKIAIIAHIFKFKSISSILFIIFLIIKEYTINDISFLIDSFKRFHHLIKKSSTIIDIFSINFFTWF